jgi:fructokinase
LSFLGDDVAGRISLEDLVKHRVDTTAVKTIQGEYTAHSMILITPWGRDRSILAFKGASDNFGVADLNESMLKDTKCFCWTSLTSDSSVAAMEKSIDIAKAAGAVIAAAPSISIIKIKKEEAIRLIKKSDIISLNDEELAAVSGVQSLDEGIKILVSWGLKLVNITLGKFGAIITDGSTSLPPHLPLAETHKAPLFREHGSNQAADRSCE